MIEKYIDNEINIEELVLFFDTKNYTKEEIKSGGIVYTPKYICDDIINKLEPASDETIFEPSVGHGIFIFSLLEYMEDKVDNLKDYFLNYVYGQDIEEKNIEEFKEIAVAFFEKRKIKLDIDEIKNFKIGDTLLETTSYDIIFGNPPYIKIQNLDNDYASFLRSNFTSCETGNIDIYFAFIEFALNNSKKFSYIVPNSWLVSKSGGVLRDLLKERLSYVIDFKDKKIFKKADTYTCIFLVDEEPSDTFILEIDNNIDVLRKSDVDTFSLKNDLKFDVDNAIIRYHTPIATLRDKIFIKDTSDSIDFYKISRVKSEEEFLNIKQKIIFPYTNDFKIKKSLNKDTLEYLNENREELAKRDRGNKDYEEWYAYGRRQGFSSYDFKNDIIIIPGMISENYSFFSVDLSKLKNKFLFSSGFILEVDKKNTKKILDFLNSEDFFMYLEDVAKIWPGKNGRYYSLSITKIKEVFDV